MLVILSGVSGAGKDTIRKELMKRLNNTTSLPSYTSRNPREDEEEGVQYHFITKEEFEKKIKNNLRLGRLEYEESKIKLYDYVIKNDDFEKTVQIIMTIIENEKRLDIIEKEI